MYQKTVKFKSAFDGENDAKGIKIDIANYIKIMKKIFSIIEKKM